MSLGGCRENIALLSLINLIHILNCCGIIYWIVSEALGVPGACVSNIDDVVKLNVMREPVS